MTLTPEQQREIRLRSDQKLYEDARQLINEKGTTTNAQISGLENIAAAAGDLSTIIGFCSHQAEKERNRGHDPVFYNGLKRYLEGIQRNLKTDRVFVPENLTRNESRERVEGCGLLLAREFLHHLAAEHRYRTEGR